MSPFISQKPSQLTCVLPSWITKSMKVLHFKHITYQEVWFWSTKKKRPHLTYIYRTCVRTFKQEEEKHHSKLPCPKLKHEQQMGNLWLLAVCSNTYPETNMDLKLFSTDMSIGDYVLFKFVCKNVVAGTLLFVQIPPTALLLGLPT